MQKDGSCEGLTTYHHQLYYPLVWWTMSLEDGNTLQGGYTVGMFRDVTSVGEFAATLGVPIKSIALIEPTNHLCTHST